MGRTGAGSLGGSHSSFRITDNFTLSSSEGSLSKTHGSLMFGSKKSLQFPQLLGSSKKLMLSEESQKAKVLDTSNGEIFTPTQMIQMEKWSHKHIAPGDAIIEERPSVTEQTEGSDSSRCFPKVNAPTVDLSQLLQLGNTPKPQGEVSLTFSPSPSGSNLNKDIIPKMEPASSNQNPLSLVSPNPGSFKGLTSFVDYQSSPPFLSEFQDTLSFPDIASFKKALVLSQVEVTRLSMLLDRVRYTLMSQTSTQLKCEKDVVLKTRSEKLYLARQLEELNEQVSLLDQKHLDSTSNLTLGSQLPALRGRILHEAKLRIHQLEGALQDKDIELSETKEQLMASQIDKQARDKEVSDLCVEWQKNKEIIGQLSKVVQIKNNQASQKEIEVTHLLASYEEEVRRRNQEIDTLASKNEALQENLSELRAMQEQFRGQIQGEKLKNLRDLDGPMIQQMEIQEVFNSVEQEFGVKLGELQEFKEWLKGIKEQLRVSEEANQELDRVKEQLISPLSGKERSKFNITSPSHFAQDLLLDKDKKITDLQSMCYNANQQLQELLIELGGITGVEILEDIGEGVKLVVERVQGLIQLEGNYQKLANEMNMVNQGNSVKLERETQRRKELEQMSQEDNVGQKYMQEIMAVQKELGVRREEVEMQRKRISELSEEVQRNKKALYIQTQDFQEYKMQTKILSEEEQVTGESEDMQRKVAVLIQREMGHERAKLIEMVIHSVEREINEDQMKKRIKGVKRDRIDLDKIESVIQEIGKVWKEAIENEIRKKVENEGEIAEKAKEVEVLRQRFEEKIAQIKGETQQELQVIELHMREECERAKAQTQTVQLQCSERESQYQKAHQRLKEEFEERRQMWEEQTRLQKDQLTKRHELQIVRLKTIHSGDMNEREAVYLREKQDLSSHITRLEEELKGARGAIEKEMKQRMEKISEENTRLRRELEDRELVVESLRKETNGKAEEEREKAKKEKQMIVERHRAEVRNLKEDQKNELIRKKAELENELKRAKREMESSLREEIGEELRGENEEEQRRWKKEQEKKLNNKVNSMRQKIEREGKEREEAMKYETERELRSKFREEKEKLMREKDKESEGRLEREKERLLGEAKSEVEMQHKREMSEMEAKMRKRATQREAKVTQELSERISELEQKVTSQRRAIAIRDAGVQTPDQERSTPSPELRVKRAFISSMSHVPLSDVSSDSLQCFCSALQLELDKILLTINDNFRPSESGMSTLFLGSINEKIGSLIGEIGAQGLIEDVKHKIHLILQRVLAVCEKEKIESRAPLQQTFAANNRISHSHSMSSLPKYEPSPLPGKASVASETNMLVPLQKVVKDLSLVVETMSNQFPEVPIPSPPKQNQIFDSYRALLNCLLLFISNLRKAYNPKVMRTQQRPQYKNALLSERGLTQLCSQIYEDEPLALFIELMKEGNRLITKKKEAVSAMEAKIIEHRYNPDSLRKEIEPWVVEQFKRKISEVQELSPELVSPAETVAFFKSIIREVSEESCIVQEFVKNEEFQEELRVFTAHCEQLLPRVQLTIDNSSYFSNSRNHAILQQGYHQTRAVDPTHFMSQNSQISSSSFHSSKKSSHGFKTAERYQDIPASSLNQRLQELMLNSSMHDFTRTPMTARYSARTEGLSYSLTPSALNTPHHAAPKSARLLAMDEGLTDALFQK